MVSSGSVRNAAVLLLSVICMFMVIGRCLGAALGDDCTDVGDCSFANSKCDGTTKKCGCVDGFLAITGLSICSQVKIGADCSGNNADICDVITNAECAPSTTRCACVNGWFASDDDTSCVQGGDEMEAAEGGDAAAATEGDDAEAATGETKASTVDVHAIFGGVVGGLVGAGCVGLAIYGGVWYYKMRQRNKISNGNEFQTTEAE